MGYKLAFFGTVAILVQSISTQCVGNMNAGPGRFGNGPSYGSNLNGIAGSFGPAGIAGSFGPNAGVNGPIGSNLAGRSGCAASTGGSFAVTSASPAAPLGVSVLSENLAIEGPLNVGGNLPFLGTVGIEGAMPSSGIGSVSYGCGSGNVGIVSENVGTGAYGAGAAAPGVYGLGASTGPNILGSYGCAGAPIASAGPYGITGSKGLGPAVRPNGPNGPYGHVGSSLGPNVAGNFGLAGLGYNNFNGLRK